jgi:putative FmdB family regulatory protein
MVCENIHIKQNTIGVPMYKDFACPSCGYEIVNIKMKLDEPKPLCPKCHIEMEQVFDKMNFRLIGNGWSGKSGRGRTK